MSRADDIRSSLPAMRREVRSAVRALNGGCSWSALVASLQRVARTDLCLARLVEGHADALRILVQAGVAAQPGVYGVWASRSAGTGLRARRTDEAWVLDGELRFASGVDVIDRVLVPGWVDDDTHVLLDVPADAFEADRDSWHTAAMDASRSFTVHADAVRVTGGPVGPENFYLARPGFAVGGIGPAAVWVGGVQLVVDLVAGSLRRFRPTPHQLRRLGTMRQVAWESAELLARVADDLDDELADAAEVGLVRTTAAVAAERVVDEAGRVVGPGGLTGDPRIARALADLLVYARQLPLDQVLEDLGRSALEDAEDRR
ncbi:MAG: acyl-CoA/acyl-ACP dehydrogenase [Nocardioidaceae bacterium]|nr:acyl-CoA/acyl-ACP dehydrogenase [Nocardioidaceae bacterium]NUS51616.1 acyl-CoA/acyl-ACP dehydrogenase [Nocardioidaceae bacterium]